MKKQNVTYLRTTSTKRNEIILEQMLDLNVAFMIANAHFQPTALPVLRHVCVFVFMYFFRCLTKQNYPYPSPPSPYNYID